MGLFAGSLEYKSKDFGYNLGTLAIATAFFPFWLLQQEYSDGGGNSKGNWIICLTVPLVVQRSREVKEAGTLSLWWYIYSQDQTAMN